MFIGLMIIFGFNEFISGFVAGFQGASGPTDATFVWSSDYVLLFFSAVFFIWGLSRIVIALVTERESRRKQKREAHSLNHPIRLQVIGGSPTALPQSHSIPAVEPGRRRLDTDKLVEPSKVNEETTRPFKDK